MHSACTSAEHDCLPPAKPRPACNPTAPPPMPPHPRRFILRTFFDCFGYERLIILEVRVQGWRAQVAAAMPV